MELVDTHVHLTQPEYGGQPGGLAGVIDRAQSVGVTHFVCPGLDYATSHQAIRLSQVYSQVIPAVGLHPLSPEESLSAFESLARQPAVKAIGEVGTDAKAGHMASQEKRLRFFLNLAVSVNKPVLVHNRHTWDDTFRILTDYPQLKGRGVIHCFTGGEIEATRCRELGLLISFTAIIARPNMAAARVVAKTWPLDQMMVETDGPWLPFPPDRGVNEPATVAKIAQFIADLRGIPFDTVATSTTQTAKRFFGL